MNAPVSKQSAEILIVEDSPTQAEKLKYILERNNYRVTAARNGKQALVLMHERLPAVVITDVVMPEMDGYELCRQIRSDPQLRNTPVILLTSLSDAHDVIKGLESGADNFITKPYNEAYLLGRIEYIFANWHLRESVEAVSQMEVHFGGKTHRIASAPHQILNLLLSIYETAIQKNEALLEAQEDLQRVNEQLGERTIQLEQANKDLEAFSYSVTHDLRTPLRSIGSFSNFLTEDYGAQMNDEARDYLARISNSVHRMNELINDLLKLFAATRGEVRRHPVDLSNIARSILDSLAHAQSDRLVATIIAPHVSGSGDESLVRVVLENLLNNAWKFTGKTVDARIEFGSDVHDDSKVFFVRDNGAGFDVAKAQKLFTPFHRLHSPSEFTGTGIGLATVKRIVERHGGRIWAESAPGRGATFYFTLGESRS